MGVRAKFPRIHRLNFVTPDVASDAMPLDSMNPTDDRTSIDCGFKPRDFRTTVDHSSTASIVILPPPPLR